MSRGRKEMWHPFTLVIALLITKMSHTIVYRMKCTQGQRNRALVVSINTFRKKMDKLSALSSEELNKVTIESLAK
ncbi:hypothetical protein M3J09_008116 [Ascochyta lentis]